MSGSRTEIPTPSASAYMVRLCKHWSHKYPVSYSQERGRIEFSEGRLCLFEADPEKLVIRLRANEPERLSQFQVTVIDHLKRFAFREDLGEIVWRADADLTA
ncbi:MAG TPA: DUF2218 domain-containing protein [Beijerinckiaceae bacterium]|nr:DUF2218 domain-containing protein [Beijerinckiaceae bacterium]